MTIIKNITASIICVFFLIGVSSAQSVFRKKSPIQYDGRVNTLTSAVPFLMIAPDSRASGMGDVGAATSSDVFSQHWNSSKYVFAAKNAGIGISYSPWLRNLVDDVSLSYLAGYFKLNSKQAIGMSLRYFSLGTINFTDFANNPIGSYSPNDFAIDVSYSFLVAKDFATGVAVRYINSNLTGGIPVNSTETHPGRTLAFDLNGYYHKKLNIENKEAEFAAGFNFSNIGGKISYTDETAQNFLPINLRIGTSFMLEIDDYNKVMATVDFNKLLIPTPPIYVDSTIIGKDPAKISVASGIFGSFGDAPGGFKEEMHEISYSAGMEYWYANQFAVRAGYFYEHETKGNRKYFTIGIGLKLNVFGLDFSYLVPTAGRNNPLANTVRFSLLFDFDGLKGKGGKVLKE